MIRSKKVKAVLLCVLLAICLTLFPVSIAMLSGNTVTAAAAGYTSIDVTVNEGYKAYSGYTTIDGLKKNIEVKGTDANGTYTLFYDEYEIDLGDGASIENGAITRVGEATEFNAIAKSGEAVFDFKITFAEGEPDFSGALSVEVKGGYITDDFTAETVHKALTVKAGEVVLTPDLYTVEMGDIYNATSATLTVRADGKSVPKEVAVNRAVLKSVELRAKSENEVFVAGTSQKDVFSKLEIVAVFENGKRVLKPTFNSQNELSGIETGESITTNLPTDAPAEPTNITVNITRGSKTASATLLISFVRSEVIKIVVNETALAQWNAHNKTADDALSDNDRVLYPYTSLNLSDMKGDDGTPVFSLLKNDGTYESNLSLISVDGSLAPDAKTAENNQLTYNKTINVIIKENSKVSVQIDIKNINSSSPVGINIAGNLTTQVKHYAFNLDGLLLELSYKQPNGRTSSASVPLSDYKDYVSTIILDDNGENEIVLNGSNYVEISVNYKDLSTNKSFDFIPVNDRITLPMTDLSTITYTAGCKKTFTDFDSGKMSLSVYNDEACKDEAEDAYELIGNEVVFKSGGTYFVKISLEDGTINGYPANEYELYYEGFTTPTGVTLAGDRRSAVYRIQINKATLAVNIEKPAGEIHYGDSIRNLLRVTGTSNGKTNELGMLGVEYQLIFVREGESYDYDSFEYKENVPELTKRDAGKYTVYAVTKESEAYLAGKVREGDGAEIEILPLEINAAKLTGSKEYARKEYSLSDFVTYSGFASGETADDVLKIAESVSLRYAGEYEIKIALKENAHGDYNYIWSDKTYTNKTVTVEITKKQFNGFSISLNKDTFYYGAVSFTPIANGADSAYFTVNFNSATYYDSDNNMVTDINAQGVGTYKVVYSVITNYIDDENTGNSFEAPKAEATFEIIEAEINRVSVDGWTDGGEKRLGDYKTNGYDITVNGWTSALANGSASQKAFNGLTFNVGYTPLSTGHTITTPVISNENGQTTFTDAGTYTVTISLNPNYKWADGNKDNIVYTVKIDRASLAVPELSDSVTYDGSEHAVTVTNWADLSALVTYTVEGKTLAANGITVTPSDETFNVTFAGKYELIFSLGGNVNNYGWDSEKSVDDQKLTYTVEQAWLQVTWNPTSQDFIDSDTVQTIEAVATVTGVDANKLVATYTIYSDENCTNEVTRVTKAGTYYLLVTAFGLKDGVTGFSTENYKLGDSSLKCTYTVNSQKLKKPDLADNSIIVVEYKGTAYNITEFFENGENYDGRLTITIEGGSELKDVIVSGDTIGSYTVKVKPEGNYKWEDNTTTEYVYTVTITKKEITFEWGQTEFTYDGNAKKPTATVKGLLGEDKDVEIDIDVNKTNADEYAIAFFDLILKGGRAHNYVLKNVAIDRKLVINRAVVALPSADKESFTFNEAKQTVNYTLPQTPSLTVNESGACTDSSYKYENGVFTFYHAGTYTVKFTLPNNYNYCWNESDKQNFDKDPATLEYTHTVTVGQMSITAPALGEKRAIERDKFDIEELELNAYVNTSYAFGEYAGGAYNVMNIPNPPERKVYFVKLTFAPNAEKDGYTPLAGDYRWIDNEEDKKDSSAWGYLTAAGGVYGKIEGNSIYLCFVITQSQVSVTFEFSDYTFGDNGWIDNDTIGGKTLTAGAHTLDNITKNSSGLITYTESEIPETATYSITVKFFTDSECKKEVETIINGLPWAAGTYYAKIDVTFKVGSDYQDFSRVCPFEVLQRAIEIEWGDNAEAVYNGNAQTRTVTVSNMRYSTADCSGSEIPELTITNSGAVDVRYVNNAVAAYDLEVTAVEGGNYTLPEEKKLTSKFTITPMALNVTAKAITYTYGDSLDFLTNITDGTYITVLEDFNDYGCIKLVLNGEVDSYGLPTAGGSYNVTPALKEIYGNYTLTAENAKFTVVKRTVTLTYNGNTTHVYGAQFTLGATADDLGVRTEGVYKLYLVNSENPEVWFENGDINASAGEYKVVVKTLDKVNYNDIVFTEVPYTVELAQITDATAKGYSGEYDGEAHEAIIDYFAKAVNNQPLTWWVAKDGNDFKEITSADGKVTGVLQSGQYKVKVTAPNHAEKILDGTVTVSITKVTVTISVNINIFYGETGPEEHGTGDKWFNQSFDKLAAGGIYSVTDFVNDTDKAAFEAGTLSGLSGKETFSYRYADGVTYEQGSPIGDYKLVFDCGSLASDNYTFEGGASNLHVAPLPVKVTLQDLTAKYNQDNPPAAVSAVVGITTQQTSIYDGEVIKVYGTYAEILNVVTLALYSETGKTTNGVGTYPITATLKNNNFTLTDGSVTSSDYEITKTQNGLLNDNYGLFEVAKSYKALNAGSENAWVYGVYTSAQTDGYNAEGDQKAVEAEFIYDEEDAQVTYTLYKDDTPLISANTLEKLFGGSLGAGDYRVQIEFPAGANYEAVDVSLYFRIGKRALTVEADAQGIQYGNDKPEFGYVVSGYANGEDIDVFVENKPVFTSVYVIGNGVGPYDIDYESGAESLDNYTVTYTGNTLTVSPREVTIIIEHKESTYRYHNDTPSEQKKLTYKIEDGSIYNSEDVFTLKTTQVKESDVGDYPIYAVFNSETFANNYKITVGNSGDNLYTGEAFTPEGTLVHANSGIYTVNPAELVVKFDANPKSSTTPTGTAEGDLTKNTTLVYDGLYKGYVLTEVPSEAQFKAMYWKAGQDESEASYNMPKEVGRYICRFVSENKNYKWNSSDIVFEITGQGLSIKPWFYDDEAGRFVDMFAPNATYKNAKFDLKFTLEGVVEGEEVAVNTRVTAVKTGDAYFVNNNSFDPFGNLVLKSEGNNVYTVSYINAGVYTVEIELDSAEDNYMLSKYTFAFTVNRDSLNLQADSTFVQYGTRVNVYGGFEAQPGKTVTKNGKDMLAEGSTLEDLYGMYRFAGFTLTDGTLDIINAQPTGFFDISELTFSVNGYDAASSIHGSSFDITPDANSVHAYNYNLTGNISGAKLNVIQRRITVTVNGYVNNESWASATYTGDNIEPAYETNRGYFFTPAETVWYGAAFGDSENIVSAAKIRLRIDGGAVNVKKDGYPLIAEQHSENGTSNYLVTFVNKGGKTPVFMIKQKALTISVVSAADGRNTFDVTYGNSTNGLYKAVYTGLVEKDGGNGSSVVDRYNIESPLVDGEITYPDGFTEKRLSGTAVTSAIYSAWLSHAGDKYQISAENSGLTFTNYTITYLTATMTVVSREIKVETENRVYTETEENGVKKYNSGASGIYHVAPVIFKDVYDGNVTYYVEYGEVNGAVTKGTITVKWDDNSEVSHTTFALKYANGQTNAPVKAGANSVAITLSGADFILDTINTTGTQKNPVTGTVSSSSVTFKYEVEKQGLDFMYDPITDETSFSKWEDGDAGTKHIDISHFVGDIMEIVSVQRISGGKTYTFNSNVAEGGGYYTVGENNIRLSVYPNGIGIYVVTVRLNGIADGNYVWNSGNQEATVQFTFSAETFKITSLSMKGWEYLGYNSVENGITITNSVGLDDTAFAFTYAEYTGKIPEGTNFEELITNLEDFSNPPLSALSYKGLPTDAGTYVLKAEYRGENYGTVVGYCLFEITPKAVKAPVFDSENVSYNMKEHTATATYDSDALGYVYATLNGNGNGIVTPSSGRVTITAVNADTYILTFTITDTRNYVWAKDAGETNGAVRLEWTIAKATDNEVTVGEIVIYYGEEFEAVATSTYGGEFTYSYALRGDEISPLPNAKWIEGKPVNAGNYWIKAVCGETANFTEKSGSGKLTINKVTLTARPKGFMTYGEAFKDAFKDITYSGWKNGELEVNEEVVYNLSGYDKESVLAVRDYILVINGSITVEEGRDEVFGFDIRNYEIDIENGVFTVNKLAVEVTIENLTAVYGEAFDPSKVTLTKASVDKLIGEDKNNPFEALNITPYVMGSVTDGYYNASAYVLGSTGHEKSANYEVSVRAGIYTVEKLDVYVTVDAGGGEYLNVTPASVTHVYTGDGIDVNEMFGNLAPKFGFLYSGTANDGTDITNSATAPALAGNYTAVARITQFVGNFNLVTDRGTPSVTFIVSRKTVNESLITVEEIKYNNEDQSPVITDEEYSDLYTAEEVAFKEVGNYTVKLTLKDADNYKWSSVEGSEYNLPFSIERGDNEFVLDITITGWNFGDSANLPETETAFGDSSSYIYTYSTSEDGEYTRTVPTAAGTYWVRVTVPQSENYNEKVSDPVKFTIGKRAVKAPTLEVVTEGENVNTTYTGARLQSAVKGYDPVLMRIIYEGDLSSAGSIAVYAVDAGEYKVYFALNDEANYTWADGTSLSGNNAQLVWNVARKKIDKPAMNTSLYMVNGGTLTFTPEGFDESTMAIAGNTTSYGGVFKVTVSIKDTVNFEWADGSVEDVTFDWVVVGWDTVFIIVVSVLGAVAGLSAVAIGLQYFLHKRKRLAQAANEAAAREAFDESVAAMSAEGDVPPDNGEPDSTEEEEPSFNEPAEEQDNQTEEGDNDNE